MTGFQIFSAVAIGSWLLWWASTHDESKAKRIARLGTILLWLFNLTLIILIMKSNYVVFSNDGPLGQMKRAHDVGYANAGKRAVQVFVGGLLLGLLLVSIIGCATKKPDNRTAVEKMTDAELIDALQQQRMNCNPYKPEPRVLHHQNPSQHNVTDH